MYHSRRLEFSENWYVKCVVCTVTHEVEDISGNIALQWKVRALRFEWFYVVLCDDSCYFWWNL